MLQFFVYFFLSLILDVFGQERIGTLNLSGAGIDEIRVDVFNSSLLFLRKSLIAWEINANSFSRVNRLDLSGNNLTTIEGKTLSKLSKLQALYLNDNQIESIQDHAFHGMTQLTELDLAFNHISRLHQDTFTGLKRLYRLFLQSNQFEYVTQGLLDALPKLSVVFLAKNLIATNQRKCPNGTVLIKYPSISLDIKTKSLCTGKKLRQTAILPAFPTDPNEVAIRHEKNAGNAPLPHKAPAVRDDGTIPEKFPVGVPTILPIPPSDGSTVDGTYHKGTTHPSVAIPIVFGVVYILLLSFLALLCYYTSRISSILVKASVTAQQEQRGFQIIHV